MKDYDNDFFSNLTYLFIALKSFLPDYFYELDHRYTLLGFFIDFSLHKIIASQGIGLHSNVFLPNFINNSVRCQKIEKQFLGNGTECRNWLLFNET